MPLMEKIYSRDRTLLAKGLQRHLPVLETRVDADVGISGERDVFLLTTLKTHTTTRWETSSSMYAICTMHYYL
jgi:hypothetical protein